VVRRLEEVIEVNPEAIGAVNQRPMEVDLDGSNAKKHLPAESFVESRSQFGQFPLRPEVFPQHLHRPRKVIASVQQVDITKHAPLRSRVVAVCERDTFQYPKVDICADELVHDPADESFHPEVVRRPISVTELEALPLDLV
jgi:hypothetical protein